MAIILIEYLLAMSLIWDSENWNDALMEQVGFATLFVPAVGVPAGAGDFDGVEIP